MISIRKKGAVYGVVALMLCVAVYLNWSYTKTPGGVEVYSDGSTKTYGESKLVDKVEVLDEDLAITVSEKDYFAESRLSRQRARDEAISILKQTLDNESSTQDAKAAANTHISYLAENSVKEARVESLIKAKGYDDTVVFISENGVNVIVSPPSQGFSAADAAKIKDIVISEANVKVENIRIVESN